jgi:hypothetical protein
MIVDHAVDDEHVAPIERHGCRGGPVTYASKHPPFVFSVRGVSCVVHKIAYVEVHWWRVGGHGHTLVKMKRPVMVAHTPCGAFFRLQGERSRTCHVPNPDAILCGRCHGEPASFGKHGAATKAGIKRQVAHVKLGCVVQGY